MKHLKLKKGNVLPLMYNLKIVPSNFGLLIIIILTIPLFLHAQSSNSVNSLLQELEQETDNINKIKLLNEIAFKFRINEDSSEKYALQALQISQSIGYEKGKGDAYVRLGTIAKNRGQYKKAESYYLSALAIRKKLNDRGPIISVYNNLGILFKNEGTIKKALEYYTLGLETIGDTAISMKAILLNGIAICHYNLGNYRDALKYNQQDIEFRSKSGDDLSMAYSLITSGNIYQKLKNFSRAEKEYKESFKLFKSFDHTYGVTQCYINLGSLYYEQSKFKKSINYNQAALKLKQYLTEEEKGIVYRSLGANYDILIKPDSALYFYNKSKDIYDHSQNFWGLADIHYGLGLLYTKVKKEQKATEHFTISYDLLRQHNISDLSLEMNLLHELSKSYAQYGNHKMALQYENRYSVILDSLTTSVIKAANYKLNYEEEHRLVEQIASQTKIQTLKKVQLIYLLIAIIIAISFGTFFSLLFFRQRRRQREMEMEIDDLLKEHEISTNYARIKGQDEERQRVARDLHDRLGSMLSTVKLYFSAIGSEIDLLSLEESKVQYNKANLLLDEACAEVRRIAHNMRSGILKNFGLKAQLENLKETINNSKQIEVKLVTYRFDHRLDIDLEENIYRITQELVVNTLKHAKASKLSIQLNRFDNIINIIIEDDGVGFKEEVAFYKGGVGLSGVENRVKAMGGTMNIDSVLGKGTSILIDIPIGLFEN